MYKSAFILILLAFSCAGKGLMAQYSNKQIDSLLNNATIESLMEGNYNASIELYKIAQKAARQNNYQLGVAKTYLLIGEIHHLQADWTTSMLYLDTAAFEMAGINNIALQVRILTEQGRNYERMFFDNKAIANFDKALALTEQIKKQDVKTRNFQHIYTLQASMYERRKNIPQYFSAIEKAYHIDPNPMVASRMTRYFLLYNKNIDSARAYIEKANKMWETGIYSNYHRSVMLRNHGLYYFTIEKYDEALALYKESLALSQKMHFKDEEVLTYKLLAEAEAKIKNKKLGDTSVEKYELLRDSLARNADSSINKIIKKEQKQVQHAQQVQKKQSQLWLYGLAIISLGIVVAGYLKIKRKSSV
ncbi:MAG: hypothetical protein EOP53_11870 [Sphingobacteriales bacterium]|nr:MAG: hypothetical protein EOP53_11870 [Sphingobacteriales bacterium]